MHKFEITWKELSEILNKQGKNQGLLSDEEIKEITLMKPKKLLIRTEQMINK